MCGYNNKARWLVKVRVVEVVAPNVAKTATSEALYSFPNVYLLLA